MRSEEMKVAGGGAEAKKAAGGQNHPAGEILHQRRNSPFSPYTMALGGFAIAAAIGYFALYVNKKPEASARDVAKVATGAAKPADTHPRK
ncbi:uncharacterized protein LOC131152217 [Malania oleifera]|uniref:uncharacterized protein LOC131152217 n=1 Tax=Malania oleifera TaxID=397392 RepID=UPI0025ADADC6|nr:uncharacterized protein LOC131152217 [Malania oleifera]